MLISGSFFIIIFILAVYLDIVNQNPWLGSFIPIFGLSMLGVGCFLALGGAAVRSDEKHEVELQKRKEELKIEKQKQAIVIQQQTVEAHKKLLEIPNLQDLVRKFVYNQLREVEVSLPSVSAVQIDKFIDEFLKGKNALLITALGSLGYQFSDLQQKILGEIAYEESQPFRKDLRALIVQRDEREKHDREKKEAQKKIDDQKRTTKEAFGEEITRPEDVQKVEKLRDLTDEIDDLLKSYASWEGKGKSEKKKD